MYRKIAIIFISVFLIGSGTITQALVAFIFVIVFIVWNLRYMPYAYKTLNIMEVLSLITCMVTIYFGIYFLSHFPEVYKSEDTKVKEADNGLRLDEETKMTFFIMILLSNLLFLLYWAYKMYSEVTNM